MEVLTQAFAKLTLKPEVSDQEVEMEDADVEMSDSQSEQQDYMDVDIPDASSVNSDLDVEMPDEDDGG